MTDLHPNVHAALIHPQRSMEMRGWLKTHHDTARLWRGDEGETMMHWAFLSDWAWAAELHAAGLDMGQVDRHGRTPMDWLNDRLWAAVVEPSDGSTPSTQRLSAGGQERLRRHTEDQIRALWAHGARPSHQPDGLHPGVVWVRAGAWSLMPLLLDPEPLALDGSTPAPPAAAPTGWLRWTPRSGNALHAWVLSPNTPGRRAFLADWLSRGQSVDCRDQDGRTPLWYAVDASLSRAAWRIPLQSVIRELMEAGADPHADDIDGATPTSLVWREADLPEHEREALLAALAPKDA